MQRWLVLIVLMTAGVADAQTPCDARCQERRDDCENACTVDPPHGDRPACMHRCETTFDRCSAHCPPPDPRHAGS